MTVTPRKDRSSASSLEGQLIIAMPRMTDRRFQRSVIFMCAHTDQGAMGLIVNQPAEHIDFPDLLERLGLTEEIFTGRGVVDMPETVVDIPVHVGGPVDTGRGFVLHSADYQAADSTMRIRDGICLTATLDILRAMATGKGPRRSLLALGYAGWSPGQLENEIQANAWLHCPADTDLIFGDDNDAKYARAMAKIGIDPSHLVADAGHA